MSAVTTDWTSSGTIDGLTIARPMGLRETTVKPPATSEAEVVLVPYPDLARLELRPGGNWANNLAIMYATGSGVAQDFAKAASWFHESASRKDDANAQFNLGILYYNGRGVSLDRDEALRWFRKAADQGNARARANLGHMREIGVGVPPNDADADHTHRNAGHEAGSPVRRFLKRVFGG